MQLYTCADKEAPLAMKLHGEGVFIYVRKSSQRLLTRHRRKIGRG